MTSLKLLGVDLLSWDFVLSFVIVLATHAAGNLCNTYYDWKNGVDKEVKSAVWCGRRKSGDIKYSLMDPIAGC